MSNDTRVIGERLQELVKDLVENLADGRITPDEALELAVDIIAVLVELFKLTGLSISKIFAKLGAAIKKKKAQERSKGAKI